MKIEDPPAVSDVSEDEISEPDEDSLAGQMAAMRGEAVKKRRDEDDSDEESEEESEEDSDSDSDSDEDSD